MAVVEIARIQVRRGQENQTGVPQLAGGEFAWAADTEKLYIGLSKEDGGSRNDNIEILTENHLNNLFNSLSSLNTTTGYIYRQGTYITAETGVYEFERTIQEKFDDLDVSILNFGVVGQGGDDTSIFQYSIDNLFLNALDLPEDPSRTLRLPTGTLNISETIFIPKHTKIIGEGPEKTKIIIKSTGTHAFQTVDYSSEGGVSGYVVFPNINSNTQPDYVYFEGLTIEYDSTLPVGQTLPMISLDCANDAKIKNVNFKGHYVPGGTTSSVYTAIEIKGLGSVTSENITIDNCKFDYLYNGVYSNFDILNPNVSYCKFNNLNRAICFNDPIDALSITGPRFGRFLFNRFENIEQQAIYNGGNINNFSTNHLSFGNQYINVGNYIYNNESATTGTAVITFLTDENRSISDYFNRYEYQFNNLSQSYYFNQLIEGSCFLEVVRNKTLSVLASTNTCVFRFPMKTTNQNIEIDYKIGTSSNSRVGKLTLNVSQSTGVPLATVTDNYSHIYTDIATSWSVTLNVVKNYGELIVNVGEPVTLGYRITILN